MPSNEQTLCPVQACNCLFCRSLRGKTVAGMRLGSHNGSKFEDLSRLPVPTKQTKRANNRAAKPRRLLVEQLVQGQKAA